MKMKLVLVEKDETLRTQLEELLAFYNLFDIVKTFDGINEANKYICLNAAVMNTFGFRLITVCFSGWLSGCSICLSCSNTNGYL